MQWLWSTYCGQLCQCIEPALASTLLRVLGEIYLFNLCHRFDVLIHVMIHTGWCKVVIVGCLLLCRNVVCRLAMVTSLSMTVFHIVRHTSMHNAGHCAPGVTSQSPAAASQRCTANITRSILYARSASVSSTRAHSRKRTTNRIVIRALYASSADATNDSSSFMCLFILFCIAAALGVVLAQSLW